jgi:hypothetical protein
MNKIEKYFAYFDNNFWYYDYDYDEIVFTIKNGDTIAYLKTVIPILKHLQPQGLPSIGSLLMVLVATNGTHEALNIQLQNVSQQYLLQIKNSNYLRKVNRFLNLVANLPVIYKTGEYRLLLFQTLFKNAHNSLSVNVATHIVALLSRVEEGVTKFKFEKVKRDNPFSNDIKILYLIALRFETTQDIINAINNISNNDGINEAVSNEDSFNEVNIVDSHEFINELSSNSKTYKIGTLVKRKWSGIKIPQHQNVPSGQPIGGFADISNKGDISQLLLSEFANESDLFVSRIINNEALYIQREIPPQEDKTERFLLIDTSITNWGTPKVLINALAISILKHPKSTKDTKVFLVGDTINQVLLNNLNDVIEMQKVLSSKIDNTSGLSLFFETYKNQKNKEVFLLLSDEAFEEENVKNLINSNRENVDYVLTTSADGQISFYTYKNRNKRLLQNLKLPIHDIWHKNEIGKVSKNDRSNNRDVPPIYYQIIKQDSRVFYVDASDDMLNVMGEYYVLSNKNWYKFNGADKGFEHLDYRYIPIKEDAFLTKDNKGDLFLLYYHNSMIYCLDLATGLFFNINATHKSAINLFAMADQLYNKFLNINTLQSLKIGNDVDEKAYFEQRFEVFQEKLKVGQQLLMKYNSYNLICNLNIVHVGTNSIYINRFLLTNSNFSKQKYISDYNNLTIFPKVNLKVKNYGKSKLELINVLRSVLGITLSQAKNIIDKELPIMENVEKLEAEKAKLEIEKCSAVLYIENTYIEFPNSSTINLEKGMLKFVSGNNEIPIFYIPFVIGMKLGFATDNNFAGNKYFLPNYAYLNEIDNASFYEKYIQEFINYELRNGIAAETD